VAKRYHVKPHTFVGIGGKEVRGFRVWDRASGRVATGTKGSGGRPGGYDTKSAAETTAKNMNKAWEEAEKERKGKGKK